MAKPVAESLRDYARGIVGGLLFSLPLLYTMEVWWAGFLAGPLRLLAYLAATFALLLGYNHFAGLRRDHGGLAVVGESLEEMGLGLLLGAFLLWLTGRIDLTQGWAEVVGKTVVSAMLVAIGVSVGKAELGRERDKRRGADQGQEPKGPLALPGQLAIAACGAVLVAANVAPTEEILVIAVETSRLKLLGLALVSLALTAAILHFSDFRGSERRRGRPAAREMAGGVAMAYGVALVVAAAELWFFGRFAGVAPATGVAQVVVLGFPAAIGSSAGRLLLEE